VADGGGRRPARRVGITGHRRLEAPGAALATLRRLLQAEARGGPLTVVSPLAEGADRLLAQAGLEGGHRLEVLLPFEAQGYRDDFGAAASRAEFDALLARAARVDVITPGPVPPPGPARDRAYLACGLAVLAGCDLLVAVWDGSPAHGLGGTADVVQAARAQGRPVVWIDAAPPCPVRALPPAPR
jgi:hypothetical protein